MKYRHYAPHSELVLLDGSTSDAIDYVAQKGESSIAVLCYDDDADAVSAALPHAVVYRFGARDDEQTQAHQLFAILRQADKQDFDTIYAPLPGRSGIGLALYNRMIRAAAHKIIKLKTVADNG